MFSRFDTIPACDGQTYRHTDGHAIMAIIYSIIRNKCRIKKKKKKTDRKKYLRKASSARVKMHEINLHLVLPVVISAFRDVPGVDTNVDLGK